MRKIMAIILAIMLMVNIAYGADYIITKVSDAEEAVDGQEARPATYEYTTISKAINEAGEEVRVRDKKINLTVPMIDISIARLEAELARLKAMKAQMK